MSKKRIRQLRDPNQLQVRIKTMYMNKYYNIFMNLFEWEGLDHEQEHYVMKKLWSDGTIAAFNIKNIDELGFAPYAEFEWNMYDFAEKVNLINERGVPFIPSTVQVVNKDVVLGWIQANHKSVKQIAEYYIDRMVQVDMVINTNIELHKMPYLIGVDPQDAGKFEDVIDRILNNELVVFTDLEVLNLVQSIQTAPQYIIDKLHAYRIQLENELLSYLGIDNSGNSEKATTMLLDEINANNELINNSQDQFQTYIDKFTDEVQEVLGKTIKAKLKAEPAEESLESRNRHDGDLDEDGGSIRHE